MKMILLLVSILMFSCCPANSGEYSKKENSQSRFIEISSESKKNDSVYITVYQDIVSEKCYAVFKYTGRYSDEGGLAILPESVPCK